MRTGETVRGDGGSTWTLGERLGRGTWGATWEVIGEEGRRAVLKVPLGAADFPSDAPLPDNAAELCTQCLQEQGALLAGSNGIGPRLEARLTLEGGIPALLLPRYTTLEQRLRDGASVSEVMKTLIAVAKLLHTAGRSHGNLRPSNILLDERGAPRLADAVTATGTKFAAQLAVLAPDQQTYSPPEGRSDAGACDTWALCAILYGAFVGHDGECSPPPPGLNKLALAQVKDRALDRLKAEGANNRFTTRFADRLCSLLNRGLAAEAAPSPPYRFATTSELSERLGEVAALVAPRVENVGRVLLASNARGGVYEGGQAVGFSVSVNCSKGAGIEDVACGVRLDDLDDEDDGRVHLEETKYSANSHPSGRLRFDFELPDVAPGRYEVTVAFTIRDSGAEPTTSKGRFEVRPPPGYVPPAPEASTDPQPLQFPASDPVPAAAEPQPIGLGETIVPPTAADLATHPSDPGVEGYPTPVAPSFVSEAASEPVADVIDIGAAPVADPAPLPAPVSFDPPSIPSIPSGGSDSEVLSASPTVRFDATMPSEDQPTQAADEGPDAPAPWAGFDDVPMTPAAQTNDDLPTYDDTDASAAPNPLAFLEPVLDFVRKDTYTAFMVVAVAALALLLCAILLSKACAP